MVEPDVINDTAPQAESPRKSLLPFPVVGIGASAGGLAAALQFFELLPDEPGMAFVLILHLSPQHDSQASAILQRTTAMPVVQVTETMPIEINHVYVIAPALQLAMEDGHLVVDLSTGPRGRPIAIDVFFRTLALAHQERAIAIVLSGTGSDGSLGLSDVKAEGGVTVVQSPNDAEYDGMPTAAIATGRADFILPVVEIPPKLSELWSNAQRIELPNEGGTIAVAEPSSPEHAAQADSALHDIMNILFTRTGSDFRHYKRGTVLRRLERRLQITRQPNLMCYRAYLDHHPQETAQLLQDMLISVTSFFRDRPAFESLERELMTHFFAKRPVPAQVRAWVVACATGEEAYSLAMLLTDHLPAAIPPIPLQVFATDIDDRALAVARAGIYPEAIVTDVPPTRLARFFEREMDEFRIKKTLREHVMFAHQNILRDPPFSRLDIISCRNLLMYLERDVQIEILELFHFALNPGGLLILGTAETADFLPEHFTIIDKRNRIYRSNPVRRPRRDLLPLRTAAPAVPTPHFQPLRPSVKAPLAQLHQRLLDVHPSVSVVIDGGRRVLHSSPGASRYLRHAEGVPSSDLIDLVLPELASALRTALLLASQSGRSVAARPVFINGEQGPITVQMTVRHGDHPGKGGPTLVLFDEVEACLAEPISEEIEGNPAYKVLESEVHRLQTQLEGTLGDSAESSEALRASNEELQSMNEELRSATEELETSKEELQSVNEELSTVNFELKTKVDETAKVNDNLSNLIASMNMATIFVDRNMLIKGFTPLSSEIFNIRTSDMGRPLNDLTHRLHYSGLAKDFADVISTLSPIEREIAAADGPWYLMRVTPYRTTEDHIDGAVLNFIDITERRTAREELRARDARLQLVAESTEDYAVITLDAAGNITGWNTGAKLMFGYNEENALGNHFRLLFTPEDRAADIAEHEMRTAAEHGRAADERWHLRQDGSRFYCSGITTPLLADDGSVEGYAKIARDLTTQQLIERQREELLEAEQQVRFQLQAAESLRAEFLAIMSHELKNPLNLILMSAELVGRSPEVFANPELSRAVNVIRRTVNGQSQIIDDLLDLSRLTTGKMAINRTALQWRPIIERIATAMLAEAHAKELTLTVETEDIWVYADEIRIEQIVWNLLSNALKFTPPGGTVAVRLTREREYGLLEIKDSGRGIDPQFLPLVFNMFEQGDRRSSTRRDKGLGIGLALVKNLVDLHEGTVEAHSEGSGQGATFSVRLPLFAGADTDQSEHPLTLENIIRNRRILLVDDDTEYLQTLAALLRNEGAEVTVAASAKDALDAAQASDFEFIISDIAMPDMDGRQLITALRNLPNSRRMSAIAVSGFGRSEDAVQSKSAGFDAHINKPLSLEILRDTLLRLSATRDYS